MSRSILRNRMVAQLDREKRAIENVGIRASNLVLSDIRRAAVAAFKAGRNPVKVVQPRMDKLQPVLADALVAGFLRGFARSVLNAEAQLGKKVRRLGVFDETIKALAERVNMTDKRLRAVRQEFGKEALTIIDEAGPAAERSVQTALLNIKKEQLNKAEGARRFGDALKRQGALVPGSNLVETLYRTQVAIGYSVGRQRANERPEIDDILWGFEYHTVGDDRVRPTHVGFDGMRAAKDAAIWDSISPPNGWNCRCDKLEVYKGDVVNDQRIDNTVPPKTVTVDDVKVAPKPDDGFDKNFADTFDADKRKPKPVKVKKRRTT